MVDSNPESFSAAASRSAPNTTRGTELADMFTDMVFNFQASEKIEKNELRQSFVLASALIKSLYSKIEFEIKEYDVKVVISLPRKVEKV